MYKCIKALARFYIVLMIISLVWYALDVIEFGSSQPSLSDTLFALILTDLIVKYIDNKE